MGNEHRDEDVLRELYVEQDLTQAKVADKLNVHKDTIQKWLSNHGIEKESTTYSDPPISEEKLKELYLDQNLTREEIKEKTGISSIQYWTNKYGIEKDRSKYKKEPPIGEEKLQDLYWNKKLSTFKIADKFEYSADSIRGWMEYYDIERRGPGGVQEPDFDKEEFERLYIEEGLGLRPVSEKLNSSQNTLARWRDRWGISPHNPGNEKFSKVDHTELVRLYIEDGLSQAEIARHLDVNVNQSTVSDWLDRLKVDTQNKAGWGQLIESDRGETVKSKLEYRTANWFYDHDIDYEYEPDIDGTNYVPDFRVGDTLIECWGVNGSDDYEERRRKKTSEYESLGFDVVSVWPVIGDRPTVEDVLPDVAWQESQTMTV